MVKKYRIYNNMEHKDLAESIKKTKPYISGIERGNLQTHLSEETLKKIADLLNMNNEDRDKILFLVAEERTPEIVLKRLQSITEVVETLFQVDSHIEKTLLRTYE